MVCTGCEPSNCNLSFHLSMIRTLKKHPRHFKAIQSWGAVKNAFVSGRNAFVFGSKRCHQNCYATKAHQQGLVSAQSCCGSMFALKTTFGVDVIYFHPKLVRDWMSLHDGTVLKTNKGCGWQNMQKWQKRSESRIEDKWCRKAVLTRKTEIRNMWEALDI